MDAVEQACRICECDGPHPALTAREMMFGLRDTFEYFECTGCGTLQIATIPSDLGKYYPQSYYSLKPQGMGWLKSLALKHRTRYALGQSDLVGKVLHALQIDLPVASLGPLSVPRSARILDVGCGSGETLERLAQVGFTHLLGADPFVNGDMRTASGVEVRKCTLREVSGPFDIIMFHHSLEHMPDPVSTLADAKRQLAPEGTCVVRIPTPSSYAWEEFRADWEGLDAPRHFVLPSRQGMAILAEKAGLRLSRIVDDSTFFVLVQSERYRRDIAAHGGEPAARVSRGERRRLVARARELNAAGRGDTIVCYLGHRAV